jgi:hypothetical protein
LVGHSDANRFVPLVVAVHQSVDDQLFDGGPVEPADVLRQRTFQAIRRVELVEEIRDRPQDAKQVATERNASTAETDLYGCLMRALKKHSAGTRGTHNTSVLDRQVKVDQPLSKSTAVVLGNWAKTQRKRVRAECARY